MPAGRTRHRPITVRPTNVGPAAVFKFPAKPRELPALDPLARDAATARVEAALFLADEPVAAKKLADACDLPTAAAAAACVARLRQLLAADHSGIEIADVAGGYQMLTAAAAHPWLLRLRRTGHDLRLTPAALETLAVVAYRQPVMRAEVDNIRGVQCGELLKVLMERGLVRVTGRHESLGRPQLYGTTKRFLQVFGLNALADLPEVAALPRPGG